MEERIYTLQDAESILEYNRGKKINQTTAHEIYLACRKFYIIYETRINDFTTLVGMEKCINNVPDGVKLYFLVEGKVGNELNMK